MEVYCPACNLPQQIPPSGGVFSCRVCGVDFFYIWERGAS